jgi:HPt (histidine-containing phosphotransfer) domain-containing protein
VLHTLVDEKSSRAEIAKQAHALKSMSLSSGMELLASTCAQIETAAKQDEGWRGIRVLIQSAETDLKKSFSAMDTRENAEGDVTNQAYERAG